MMDGRVKTLHPVVHGGLLALRDNDEHVAAMDRHGIGAIDLVVVNLYPFEETVAKGAEYDEVIENIDIGGPAMIRSAAKNHGFVNVIVDVEDYAAADRGLERHNGQTTYALRQRLAQTPMPAPRPMTPPLAHGWQRRSAAHRGAALLAAPWPRPCAMAKTRTKRRRFIPMVRPARRCHSNPASGQGTVL